MPPPSFQRVMAARLRSIRDVAHDLGLEIFRARINPRSGFGINILVEHILREADAALSLLDKEQQSKKRRR